jgi:hypothetical protein
VSDHVVDGPSWLSCRADGTGNAQVMAAPGVARDAVNDAPSDEATNAPVLAVNRRAGFVAVGTRTRTRLDLGPGD